MEVRITYPSIELSCSRDVGRPVRHKHSHGITLNQLVSGSPFLKCQERQFMVQEGSVAQMCFVLRNAERLSRQLTVTANVFPQNAGTANGK